MPTLRRCQESSIRGLAAPRGRGIRWLLTLALLVAKLSLGTAPIVGQNPPFKVVVHPSNPVASVSREQLSKSFLKQIDRWEDGKRIVPVNLAPDSPVREAFSQVVHRRSATRINSYWQQQIYSGSGVPPPQRASERALLDFIRTNRGAVGYVSQSSDTGGVKVISVTGL